MEFTINDSAAKFIKRMIRLSGSSDSGFRLVVTPGGCSGLAAEFSVESKPQPNDATIEKSGCKLFLPAESRLLLDGVTIDFAETAMESGFVFRSPTTSGSACSSSAPAPKLVSLG